MRWLVDRPRIDIDTRADLELARRIIAPNYQEGTPWTRLAGFPD